MSQAINEKQLAVLQTIVTAGASKVETKSLDKRSIRALASRGLVKVTSNSKGEFVSPTASGKKIQFN